MKTDELILIVTFMALTLLGWLVSPLTGILFAAGWAIGAIYIAEKYDIDWRVWSE